MKSKNAKAYSKMLREFYGELETAQDDREHSSPLQNFLGALLDEVSELPSPQKEQLFVDRILGGQKLNLRKAA